MGESMSLLSLPGKQTDLVELTRKTGHKPCEVPFGDGGGDDEMLTSH